MKVIKIGAAVLAVILLLVIGAVAWFAATFDANEHRARVTELVKEKTGRDLRIDGDIRLTFFPRLGVALGKVALSGPPPRSGAPAPSATGAAGSALPSFAQIDAAQVSLRLMPLFTGQLIVDRIVLSGLAVELVRHADGSTNFDDLTKARPQDAGKPDTDDGALRVPAIDVAGIEITGARIGWRDERDGSELRISEGELRTGRIAASVPGELTLRAHIDGTKPEIALQAELLAGYRFEPATRLLQVNGFAASLRGDVPGNPGLDANLSILEARFDGAKQDLALTNLRLLARDAAGLNVTLSTPAVHATPERITGEATRFDFLLDRDGRKIDAKITLAAPAMRDNRVVFERLSAKIELRQPDGLTMDGEIGTPIDADLGAKTVAFSKLSGVFRLKGPSLPPAGVQLDLTGAGGLDWGKSGANAELSARLDRSNVQARIRVRGFTPPVLEVALMADRLDLDPYLGADAAKPRQAAAADAPIDLRALAGFNGSATLRAGSLRVKGITATNLNVGLRGTGGKLDIEPLRAEIYRGTVQTSARIDAATGALSANGVLTGIDIGPLLRDLGDTDVLEGRGNARFALATRGATVSAVKRALDGTATLALRNGVVKGINLAQAIRKAKASIGAGKVVEQGAQPSEQTDFSALDASFVIKDGVARNDDLAMKSPLLRVGGEGTIDIGAGSVNYLLKTSIVGTLSGQGGRELESLRGVTIPVRISGPFEKLAYKLDLSGALADTAKQQLRSRIEEQLGLGKAPADGGTKKPALPAKPADLLKGLFGR